MGWLTGCFQRGMYKIKLSRTNRALNKVLSKTERIKNQIKQVEKAKESWITAQTNCLKAQEQTAIQNAYNNIYATYGTTEDQVTSLDSTTQSTILSEKSKQKTALDTQLENAIQSLKDDADTQYQVQLDTLQQEEESLELEKQQLEDDKTFYSDAIKAFENNKDELKSLIPNSSGN